MDCRDFNLSRLLSRAGVAQEWPFSFGVAIDRDGAAVRRCRRMSPASSGIAFEPIEVLVLTDILGIVSIALGVAGFLAQSIIARTSASAGVRSP
jgi:hypothetical protein